jgi:hypothetical protein
MPWYKLQASYGPGHQSGHTTYKFSDTTLTEEERRDILDREFADRDWPIGTVIALKGLPRDIKIKKMDEISLKIECLKKLLNTVIDTKEIPYTKIECLEALDRMNHIIHTKTINGIAPRPFPQYVLDECKKYFSDCPELKELDKYQILVSQAYKLEEKKCSD